MSTKKQGARNNAPKPKFGSWVSRTSPTLKYMGGYKYQLRDNFKTQTELGGKSIANEWIVLGSDGELLVRSGYAWDGPSGPTLDWPIAHVMPASLVHDALYQLIREGLLHSDLRVAADRELYRQAIKFGMWKVRAKAWHLGVQKFGGKHATKPKKVIEINDPKTK